MGPFHFKHLPYDIHSAREVFQEDVKGITEGYEDARNSHEIIICIIIFRELDPHTESK